jgi:hypothetical protein
MKSTALQVFRQPPARLNCAQAVIHSYRAVSKDDAHSPEDFKGMGGGKAPDGICGALFAACTVHSGDAPCLIQRFLSRLGGITCKELKGGGVSCESCVGVAAELLEESLNGKRAG